MMPGNRQQDAKPLHLYNAILYIHVHFSAAVNDPEVRRFLRDERLQHILHQIDRANDREVALAGFLESPDFQEFSNMLLKRINDA